MYRMQFTHHTYSFTLAPNIAYMGSSWEWALGVLLSLVTSDGLAATTNNQSSHASQENALICVRWQRGLGWAGPGWVGRNFPVVSPWLTRGHHLGNPGPAAWEWSSPVQIIDFVHILPANTALYLLVLLLYYYKNNQNLTSSSCCWTCLTPLTVRCLLMLSTMQWV